MQLARVIGTVVATQKYEGLTGVKFLVVQPLSKAAGAGWRARYFGRCDNASWPGRTRVHCWQPRGSASDADHVCTR